MPGVAFFQRLGVFAIKEFLDSDLCTIIQSEMQLSKSVSPAEVYNWDGNQQVDVATRKTKLVKVSKILKDLVKQHLADVKPKLEDHFGLSLDDCESPQFLAYKEGDFFKPHTDSTTSENCHDCIQQRRISVVIFLNGESANIDLNNGYTGGSLILYGLIQKTHWENCGFNINGEPGLMIAFASDVCHEVTPVTQGMRFTMVSWFPAKSLNLSPVQQ